MPGFPGPFPAPGSSDEVVIPYSRQFADLLPPGIVWNLEADSEIRKVLLACADEYERLRDRGWALIEETDPRTASETIGDWETALGLPDERITSIPSTLAARRVAVTAKYTAQGGSNYAYYEALCAACGYPLDSIVKGRQFMLRVGFRCSDRVYGDGYAYSMRLVLDPRDPDALPQADFERVIEHVTHAHIKVEFEYL